MSEQPSLSGSGILVQDNTYVKTAPMRHRNRTVGVQNRCRLPGVPSFMAGLRQRSSIDYFGPGFEWSLTIQLAVSTWYPIGSPSLLHVRYEYTMDITGWDAIPNQHLLLPYPHFDPNANTSVTQPIDYISESRVTNIFLLFWRNNNELRLDPLQALKIY